MNMRIIIAFVLLAALCPCKAIYKEPITTRQGHIFTIKIPNTQTAGIDWFFGNKKELTQYIQLINSKFVSTSTLNNGRMGKKIFTFKALKAGKVTMKLVKRKSWENKELDHKLIKVIIKPTDSNTAL
jgi:predicted secreted protein